MDGDFIERERRALEVPEDYVFKEAEHVPDVRRELRITQRVYPVPWDEQFSLNAAVLYPDEFLEKLDSAVLSEIEKHRGMKEARTRDARHKCFYLEGTCGKQGALVARFTVSGDITLLDFARAINGTGAVSSRSFFAMNDTIYLFSPEEPNIKFARLLLIKKYKNIGDWDTRMRESIGQISEEMFYFNGSFSIAVQVEKAYLSQRRTGSYLALKHLRSKSLLCKCCSKRNADRAVVDDPILPGKCKSICAQCFNLLFMDAEGEYRYGEIKYESFY
jgi:hypothetical protein